MIKVKSNPLFSFIAYFKFMHCLITLTVIPEE